MMPKTTQLVLSLRSKTGVLAGISRALADAKVNILSLSAAEAAGRGKIRLVVNKPTIAKRALRKARVRFVEEIAFAKSSATTGSPRAGHRETGAGAREHQVRLCDHGWARRRDGHHHRRQRRQGSPSHRLARPLPRAQGPSDVQQGVPV